jgi:hypothetical protein
MHVRPLSDGMRCHKTSADILTMDKTPNCGEFDVAKHENVTLQAAHAKMAGHTNCVAVFAVECLTTVVLSAVETARIPRMTLV